MEIDGTLALIPHQNTDKAKQNAPTHMDEEPNSIDMGDLDILALEAACHQREYNKIPPRQINSLEVVIFIAQQRNSLGIQAGSLWDGNKIMKETKK